MTHVYENDSIQRDGGGRFLSGLFFGGLLGATAALLLAPSSGEAMRSLIRRRTGEFKEQAQQTATEARDRVERVVGETLIRADGLKTRGQQEMASQKARVRRTARAAALAARAAWDEGANP